MLMCQPNPKIRRYDEPDRDIVHEVGHLQEDFSECRVSLFVGEVAGFIGRDAAALLAVDQEHDAETAVILLVGHDSDLGRPLGHLSSSRGFARSDPLRFD
jgi:hypothetical protein